MFTCVMSIVPGDIPARGLLLVTYPDSCRTLEGLFCYDIANATTLPYERPPYVAFVKQYVPHCIEPSLGVDRVFLALICSAYDEDEVGGEKRNFLRFHPSIAPVKASVLPLVKNKPEIVGEAREVRISR